MTYIHRELESKINNFLTTFPSIAITGPRQAGKSTVIKHLLAKNYRYITFDNTSILKTFYDDPKKFIETYNNNVIFDEAQKAPELFEYIKIAIDEDRDNYGKFVLTGSNQFNMTKRITESLAGRIGLLTLLPLQFNEIPPTLRSKAIIHGSYPELVKRDYSHWNDWYDSYMSTYLEKDIKQLYDIGNLRAFEKLIYLLAANTSQNINFSTIANSIGVSVPTITKWISVLEASYIIYLLPPYYNNYGKRLTKSPKIYFFDTGLVAHLTGTINETLYERGPLTGAIFENYVIMEIIKKEWHKKTTAKFYYYRTSNNAEIDLIINKGIYRELIEIKHNHTFNPKMIKHIKPPLLDENSLGYLLYNGDNMPYTNNIHIMNYKDYLL